MLLKEASRIFRRNACHENSAKW